MQSSPITPTIGRVVHFVALPGSHAANEAEIAPAVIVKLNEDETVNLKVLTNHPQDEWHKDVPYSEGGEPGTWAWPGAVTQGETMTLDEVKASLNAEPGVTLEQVKVVLTGLTDYLWNEDGADAQDMMYAIDAYWFRLQAAAGIKGPEMTEVGKYPEQREAETEETPAETPAEPSTEPGPVTPAEPAQATTEEPKAEPEVKAAKGKK